MVVVNLQFGGILYSQQALVPWNKHPQTIECGRLTRTCTTSDDKVGWAGIEALNPNPHHGRQSAVDGSPTNQIDDGDGIFAELSNGECGAIR